MRNIFCIVFVSVKISFIWDQCGNESFILCEYWAEEWFMKDKMKNDEMDGETMAQTFIIIKRMLPIIIVELTNIYILLTGSPK